MNFLKISGLVIGTGSVVGGAGAGIYYGINKNSESNGKVNFVGKLVFFKKLVDSTNTLYEVKFLNETEYTDAVTKFNLGKTNESEKYSSVNKIVDISHSLNIEATKSELKNIFGNEITLANAKTKITSDATKLKDLFGTEIYTKLQTVS